MESPDGEEKRICVGCFRGEVPSEAFKQVIRTELELNKPSTESSFVDKFMDKAAAKVSETFRLPVSPSSGSPTNSLTLIRGSAYPDDKKQSTSKSLPSSGYFEIMNKSESFCAIKVLRKGINSKFEVPRPSYMAGTIHLFTNAHPFDLIILCYIFSPTKSICAWVF